MFSASEKQKIQSSLELSSLYEKGILNGDFKQRHQYLTKMVDQMANQIEQSKAKLEKENAKKIDVARLGLSIQKLAQEVDAFEHTQLQKTETSLESIEKYLDSKFQKLRGNVNKTNKEIELRMENKFKEINKEMAELRGMLNLFTKDIVTNKQLIEENNQRVTKVIKRGSIFGMVLLIVVVITYLFS
ncbi:MAG: hypothetical protein ABJI69_01055 [Balneola sp.]